jgi:hypothetical protein
MGTSWGQEIDLGSVGTSITIIASPNGLIWKVAGVTIEWPTVPVVAGTDVIWRDGVIVPVGERGLRYGQILQEITAVGPAQGHYGPYDPAAVDGRGTPPARGRTFILFRTLLERQLGSNHTGGLLEGGRVYRERLIATTGAASLAAGPTFAALEAALPMLRYAT